MKKISLLMFAGLMFLIFNGAAFAAVHVYNPSDYNGFPDDLKDLDHNAAYSWGIDVASDVDFASGERITGFSLVFENIANWDTTYNVLFADLLQGAPEGVVEYGYGNTWPGAVYNPEGDYFLNSASTNRLFKFENLNETPRDLYVNIDDNSAHYDAIPGDGGDIPSGPAMLTISANGLDKINYYASNGIFGLGFDPDCHFWNDGITLTLTTTSNGSEVPEPATLMLFGAGLLGIASTMRKKKKA